MGWERLRYEATCQSCGHKGFVTRSDDDWGRSATWYEGFANIAPDATAVARKRCDKGDNSPRCMCGSTEITTGALISKS